MTIRSCTVAFAAARIFLVALVALPAGSADAGTIGFRTDAKVSAGPGVDVEATLTHTGDEPATEVSVRAELLDKSMQGEKIAAIQPGKSQVWNFHLADSIAPGVYAITLRTRYTDNNGYPFETVSLATAPVGVKAAPRIFGSLELPPVSAGGEIVAKLTAKRPPQRSGNFKARLVVPDGIDVTPKEASLEFDATGRATAQFQLKNRKMLAGTTLNVFAFVSGDDAGFPQVDTIRGSLRVSTPAARVRAPVFYEVAAALFALLLALEAYAWVTGLRTKTVHE